MLDNPNQVVNSLSGADPAVSALFASSPSVVNALPQFAQNLPNPANPKRQDLINQLIEFDRGRNSQENYRVLEIKPNVFHIFDDENNLLRVIK